MGRKKSTNQSQNDSGVIRQRSDKRRRKQTRFWTDSTNDAHASVDSYIVGLKKKRKFQPTVIDALRLFESLQSGDTSVLRELFPGIVELIGGATASADFNQMLAMMAEMNSKLQHQPITVSSPTPVDDFTLPELHITDETDMPTSTVEVGATFLENVLSGFD